MVVSHFFGVKKRRACFFLIEINVSRSSASCCTSAADAEHLAGVVYSCFVVVPTCCSPFSNDEKRFKNEPLGHVYIQIVFL